MMTQRSTRASGCFWMLLGHVLFLDLCSYMVVFTFESSLNHTGEICALFISVLCFHKKVFRIGTLVILFLIKYF